MVGAKRQARLGAPAILRILSAAGIKTSRPYLDVDALASCIDVCFDLYRHAQLSKAQTMRKKERDQLKRVHQTASRLKHLLVSTPSAHFVSNYRQAFAEISKLVEDTNGLLNLGPLSKPSTGLESDYVDGLAHENHFKSKSPLQWMVGVYLREVFEIFVSEPNGGSYLQFVHQVLKELKIKNGNSYYSLESIARAARGYKRIKKLGASVDQDEWTNDRALRFSFACGLRPSLDPQTELRRREQEKVGKTGAGNSG